MTDHEREPSDLIQAVYKPPGAEAAASSGASATPDPDRLGWWMLLGPALGGAAFFALPNLSDAAGFALGFAFTLPTTILMWLDASKRGAGERATGYLIGAVLLFAIAFPLYMHRRKDWGAPSKLPHAMGAMALYFAGAFYPLWGIAQPAIEVQCVMQSDWSGTYACDVTQVAGEGAARWCFDLVASCGRTERGRTHSCGRTEPRQKVMQTVKVSADPNCAGGLSLAIDDISVEPE